MLDLILAGGTVVDGTGSPRRVADVGIRDRRISAVGDLADEPCTNRVNARGMIVSPGFIDVHTHDDRLVLDGSGAKHPKLSQGVTTVVTGNCGVSLAPLRTDAAPVAPLDLLGREGWIYDHFSEYLDAVEASAPAVNVAALVGHSTLRVKHVTQLDRRASPLESSAMAEDLRKALEAGAIGLSTGLYYPPSRAADAAEVIEVGQSLLSHGGLIAMHLRDEGDNITDALREGLHIGKSLGVPIVLSHHKLVGKANHGRSTETLALIEDAATQQEVCLDCYPYFASSTMLLPERVRQSTDVLITWSKADPEAAGKSLLTLAQERNMAPEALARALQPAGAIYFAMSEDDVSRILSHPMTMVGSDGLAHDIRPHPRLWGSFPRVLGHYVRDRRLFPLETAVHKMTGLPARKFNLAGRGLVTPGHSADIVIFDAELVADKATFEDPERPSVGVEAVYVNGQLACHRGRLMNLHAGQVLRRGGTTQ